MLDMGVLENSGIRRQDTHNKVIHLLHETIFFGSHHTCVRWNVDQSADKNKSPAFRLSSWISKCQAEYGIN